MTKWVIGRIVPSEAGIIQLWVVQQRRLELLHTETNYYSGLRNRLIEIVDELAPAGKPMRDIIGRRETWFRYSILNSHNQLQVLEEWFSHRQCLQDSEKREVRVQEIETLKKFPLPPLDVQIHERKSLDIKSFGHPLPDSFSRS
ncbi:MAG: hypothetical protein B0D92_02385 [Spirochaeta sp. LUC14_002_19_P3]|nr:MAG: hypothetical protein B0D92_02385 [Spirochaeta sp. LUC14_002_19_P3]